MPFRKGESLASECGKKYGFKKGSKNISWIGGKWIDRKGYVRIRKDNLYVLEHRDIMENYLGRKLLPTEDVHHIDGNKQNNELNNLLLIDHNLHSMLTNNTRNYKHSAEMKNHLSELRKNMWKHGIYSSKKSILT